MVTLRNQYGTYQNLDKWCRDNVKLCLKSLKQVMYSDGKIVQEDLEYDGKYLWFVLELTDGLLTFYIDIQVDKEAKIKQWVNILKHYTWIKRNLIILLSL